MRKKCKKWITWRSLSQSDFSQIHSNPIKATPFGSILITHPNLVPIRVQIHFLPSENMWHIIGGIMLSIPSLYTSFWDTIQTHGHFITPYLHLDVPQLVKGFADTRWFYGMTFEWNNPHQLAMNPYLVWFLFSICSWCVLAFNWLFDTLNSCISMCCIFSALISSIHVPLPNFWFPWTLSYSLSLPIPYI